MAQGGTPGAMSGLVSAFPGPRVKFGDTFGIESTVQIDEREGIP